MCLKLYKHDTLLDMFWYGLMYLPFPCILFSAGHAVQR